MGKYSEKSKEYTAKYIREHYSEMKIRVPFEDKDKILTGAITAGLSLNAFVARAALAAADAVKDPERREDVLARLQDAK